MADLFNEFRENAKSSVLGHLEDKGFRVIRLDQQYRMAKSIASWPASFFYKSRLHTHRLALEDNETRQIARKISKEHYNVKGENGHGSEYWVVNTMYWASHAQKGGTSLVNHANAEAIAELVNSFLAEGQAITNMVILTYYTGQKYVILQKLRQTANPSTDGQSWEVGSIGISTVDAYQGQERPIVILDFVVGRLGTNAQEHVSPDEDDEDDLGENKGFATGHDSRARASAYARDAHRLCCALTRAKDCLVVFMQTSLLLATAKSKQRKARAAVSDCIRDAMERGLVYNDNHHLDSNPEGLQMRAKWSSAQEESELAKLMEAQNKSIRSNLRTAKHYISNTGSQANIDSNSRPPVIHTQSGPTIELIDYRPDLKTLRDDPNRVIDLEAGGETQRKAKNGKAEAAKEAEGSKATLVQLTAAQTSDAKVIAGVSSKSKDPVEGVNMGGFGEIMSLKGARYIIKAEYTGFALVPCFPFLALL